MDHQEKDHHHKHQEPGFHEDGGHKKDPGRRWHKDWRVWSVVVIMLAALAAYVLTLDDFYSLIGQPGAKASANHSSTP